MNACLSEALGPGPTGTWTGKAQDAQAKPRNHCAATRLRAKGLPSSRYSAIGRSKNLKSRRDSTATTPDKR